MLKIINDSDKPIITSKGIIREHNIIDYTYLEDYDPLEPFKYEYSYDKENDFIIIARKSDENNVINPYIKYYIDSYYATEK